jgi:hypothetical protein
MRFESETESFEAIESDPAVTVYVVKGVKALQRFKFNLKGYGELPKTAALSQGKAHSVSTGPETTSKQNLQLTPTIWILIAVALTAAIGIATWWRTRTTVKVQIAPADPGRLLRDELFELESAKLRGEISPDAYQKRHAEIRSSIKHLPKS